MTALPTILRRSAVIAGVTMSLVLGALTVRAAGEWTAANAPLSTTPVSAETLQAQLASEQDRSATLEDQLKTLTSQTGELSSALQTAKDRIASDTSHATDLQKQLDAAKARLAQLEKLVAQAQAALRARAAAPAPATTTTVTTAPTGGEHESGGDD